MKNKIEVGFAEDELEKLYDNSIDLTITSPPYFNLKRYDDWNVWNTYQEYLDWVEVILTNLHRVTKNGRFVCWNIQDNLPNPTKDGRKYYALMPDTIKIAQKCGFEWECNIIWNKSNATQIMLGSYPFPPTMIYRQVTESICIFRKFGKADLSNKNLTDKLDKQTWSDYTNIIWNIAPKTKSDHPAPFPEEIPKRLIKLHSFTGDVVLDPFVGSGTTCKVANDLDRRYIGFDSSEEYIDMTKERLKID
tara:strand:- start:246 stop:989 length:744 start_codon:yes stop_codon:yes gene_type:complete